MENSKSDDALSAMIPQSEEPLLGLALSDSFTHTTHSSLVPDGFMEEALSQKFENVGLRSKENEDLNDDEDDHNSKLHPLRPYVEDCPYFIRTGMCKFGLSCRFNHPMRKTNQKVGKDKEKEAKVKEGHAEQSEQIECKFYLTAGGCKYGTSCKYYHPKDEYESEPPELNFLGLPIREGERECPFYMRNGSCGYGARCKFHHPDPTAVGAHDPHNSTPNDEVWKYCLPSEDYNGQSIPLHVSGASQLALESWPSQVLSDFVASYQDNHSSYIPTMHFLPLEPLQTAEWHEYHHPDPYFQEERIMHPYSTPAMKDLTEKADTSSQVDEFLEGPGQLECDHFMKTGDSMFKTAWLYHRPKHQFPIADCVLSDTGLPLRPDRKICPHYEQFGICKFGRACLFDHPMNQS